MENACQARFTRLFLYVIKENVVKDDYIYVLKMTMEDTERLTKEDLKTLAHDKEQWSHLCRHL